MLGDRHTLLVLIAEQRVTTLILAITHEVNGELLQILMDCLEHGVEIIPMPVLYEQLTGRVPVEHVGGNWYVVPDAEKGRAVWAEEDDPRVTRVGRALRKPHVDEFPQFLNILKACPEPCPESFVPQDKLRRRGSRRGEMSAVGPRPERPEFVEELAREIPFYRVRQCVAYPKGAPSSPAWRGGG